MQTSRTGLLKGTAVSVGVFLLFGTVTGLVPNPLYVRMVPRTPLDYLFLVATAAFAGAYYARRSADRPQDGLAFGGFVGGVLAFGCPVCNGLLLALFSSSALMTHFDPLRPVLGTLSVALFGGLLYSQHRRDCRTCA